MIAEIQTPQLILIGEGSLARIGEVLQKVGIARPLVVTDRVVGGRAVGGRGCSCRQGGRSGEVEAGVERVDVEQFGRLERHGAGLG